MSNTFFLTPQSAPPSEDEPNLNVEVYIDDRRFYYYHIIQIRWKLNDLSTFQINYGDEDRNRRWIKEDSTVEVYLSWGSRPVKKYFSGVITKLSRNVSNQRYMVSASGLNAGLYMRDKQAWDSTYNRLSYNNERVSKILSDLASQVTSLDFFIKPYSSEPSMSVESEQDGNILSLFKKVSSYGGYEWLIDEDGRLSCREELDEIEANSKFSFILGDADSYSGLPELPYAIIRGTTHSRDYGSIKNFYKVNGKDGIYGTGYNQFSINKYGRISEGEITDDTLTSVQSCEIAARKLAEVNGEPRVSIPIKIRGNTNISVGDIIYCDDLDRMIFTSLDNQYLKVFQKNDTIGKSGWSSDMIIGHPKRDITDILG